MYYGYTTRHKVFTSFYHKDDQKYKDYIDRNFSHLIINKSIMNGEYDPDNSDAYIKRLIREDKVSGSSVVIVLVGPNTKGRKHVDWEIYAGLIKGECKWQCRAYRVLCCLSCGKLQMVDIIMPIFLQD